MSCQPCAPFILFLALVASRAPADDWPHWLGPERDGSWNETGILREFPEDGPEVLWSAEVGAGYSGPAVAGGKVYLTDFVVEEGEVVNNPGKAIALRGTERILCYDLDSGERIWKHEDARRYELSYPGGPRCTPTVAGGRVYVLGGMGDLTCLDAASGDLVWRKNLPETFGSEIPIWGFSAHPLVHDGLVYTMGGGGDGVVVALDAETGETRWTAVEAPQPGYCPPILIEHAGTEQLIVWSPLGLNSLDPETGAVHWSKPLKPNFNMAVTAPRKSGNRLFASGIGRIGALYELEDDKPGARILWKGKPKTAVYCSNSTPVIVGDTIYGVDIDTSQLMAVSMEDGRRLWGTTGPVMEATTGNDRHGTAFLTRHVESGLFYLFNEAGELVIARLTPDAFTELSRTRLLEPTNEAFGRAVVWSPPAFADRSILVRNDKQLVRVKLAAE